MERIISKIKKLLALAMDAGATEGERDNAMRMAHGLLAKHNLDMQDVQVHGATVEERIDFANHAFGMVWCRQVSMSVAKLFFCRYYSSEGKQSDKRVHHFVGKESNATTAALMAEYINNSIVKECRKRFKGDLTPDARAFGVGAADKIRERVYEMTTSGKAEGVSESTAIVVRDIYKTELEANEAYLESRGVKLVKGRGSSKNVRRDAYNSGKEFGQGVGLNTQIDPSKPKTQLK